MRWVDGRLGFLLGICGYIWLDGRKGEELLICNKNLGRLVCAKG